MRKTGAMAAVTIAMGFGGYAEAESLDAYVVAKGASRNYPLTHTGAVICRLDGQGCRRASTGRDGRLYVSSLRPGKYEVRILLPGKDYFTEVTVRENRRNFVRIVVRD